MCKASVLLLFGLTAFSLCALAVGHLSETHTEELLETQDIHLIMEFRYHDDVSNSIPLLTNLFIQPAAADLPKRLT